jgi:hypothetical protein
MKRDRVQRDDSRSLSRQLFNGMAVDLYHGGFPIGPLLGVSQDNEDSKAGKFRAESTAEPKADVGEQSVGRKDEAESTLLVERCCHSSDLLPKLMTYRQTVL